MARTRAVPRRRPNINFQPRGNIDFERQRVAATRNISSPSSSASSSSSSSSSANRSPVARRSARSPLGNLARNLARDIGRNPVRSPPASRPASPIVRPRRRIRRRISSESSTVSSQGENLAQVRNPPIRRRRVRASDVKIKFVLPRVKDVEVKHRGNVVRKMKVRRVAKHAAKKKNVRYGDRNCNY